MRETQHKGHDQILEHARHAEHEARGAFIKTVLAGTVDLAVLDRLRLRWVQTGDELDKLLASRNAEVEMGACP